MKASICDLTGEVSPAAVETQQVSVEINPTVRLQITAQTRESDKHGWVGGDLGKRAAEAIRTAIKDAAAKLAKG